jgi:site-specific recombinase
VHLETLVIGSLSLVLLAVVLALVREVRLRRALQELLRRLLAFWRNHTHDPDTPFVPPDGSNPRPVSDRRLHE